jgi:hypothetical protein
MNYAITLQAKSAHVYERRLIVQSVHKSFDLAYRKCRGTLGIVQVSDDIKKGDVIDSDGVKL